MRILSGPWALTLAALALVPAARGGEVVEQHPTAQAVRTTNEVFRGELTAHAEHADRLDAELNQRTDRRLGREAVWEERISASPKLWVYESPDRRGRTIVDFEQGWIEAQVLVPRGAQDRDASDVRSNLEDLIQWILAWREPLTAHGSVTVVADQVAGLADAPADGPACAAAAHELVQEEKIIWQPVDHGSGATQQVATIRLPLVDDHLQRRGARHRSLVGCYATKFGVDPDLVMSVIEVESAFNPRAISPAGALGLMQIVPESAGRDALELCPDLPNPLPREAYFDPETNIRLGCAYLHILEHRRFAGVRDRLSRRHMTLAAYNGGAGSVARALAGTNRTADAVRAANAMDDQAVYEQLRTHLPQRETRTYLLKVAEVLSGHGRGKAF
ncbi:MAG: transglycosylase SLT domain-containing protein [Candidatus Eisenbacteria sp.]|nr:transglycosylase SLT domain-containing protein [Candidatus Eisenbacteria bacterium]